MFGATGDWRGVKTSRCLGGGGIRAALKWLACGLLAGGPGAFGSMSAVRSIEAGFLAGGGNAYETKVTVSVKDAAPSSMILQEVLPEGWTVESATWNGVDFMPRQVSGGTNKWLFGLGTAPGAGVLKYVVRTTQAEERTYAMTGCLTYLAGSEQIVVKTAGDEAVWTMDRDGDGLPDDWERQYYGGATACDATADTDMDGMTALDEFVAGTDPNNPASVLQAALEWTEGALDITWTPRLGNRRYRVLAKKKMEDAKWEDVTDVADWQGEGWRFFAVTVEEGE